MAETIVDWESKRVRSLLGTCSDQEVADRLGVSRSRVKQKRDEFEIPAYEPPLPEGRDERSALDLLHSVPLSVEQREALVAARRAKGWTQAQLAEGMGADRMTVARLEQGSTFVSPKLFRRLLAALDLELTTARIEIGFAPGGE